MTDELVNLWFHRGRRARRQRRGRTTRPRLQRFEHFARVNGWAVGPRNGREWVGADLDWLLLSSEALQQTPRQLIAVSGNTLPEHHRMHNLP